MNLILQLLGYFYDFLSWIGRLLIVGFELNDLLVEILVCLFLLVFIDRFLRLRLYFVECFYGDLDGVFLWFWEAV